MKSVVLLFFVFAGISARAVHNDEEGVSLELLMKRIERLEHVEEENRRSKILVERTEISCIHYIPKENSICIDNII